MPNTLSVDIADGVDQIVDQVADQVNEQAQSRVKTSAIGVSDISASQNPTLRGILNEAESQAILQALQFTGWNRKRAARLLKISYRGLLYKIRRHSIAPPVAGD